MLDAGRWGRCTERGLDVGGEGDKCREDVARCRGSG